MELASFGVEEWLNEYETKATYDLSQSTVASLTVDELIRLDGSNPDYFFKQLYTEKLNYGYIEGSPEFKQLVSELYKTVLPDNVLQTNGATGANLLAVYALVETGDHVLTTNPTYQQLSDMPRSLGATVEAVDLVEEESWRVPINALLSKIRPTTKLITLNCANNPTGSLVETKEMQRLVDAARKVGAYILVDEVYYPFDETDYTPIVELYERGISVNSLSKTYSLPGLRVGWTATSSAIADLFRKYRDYTMICAGILNDALAVHALKNRKKIIERNRNILETNRFIVEEWMKKEKRVSWELPQLVSTSCVKLDIPILSREFCIELLQSEGVLLVPGSAFGLEGHVRLGYGCHTEVLKEGLQRLSRFLEHYESVASIKKAW